MSKSGNRGIGCLLISVFGWGLAVGPLFFIKTAAKNDFGPLIWVVHSLPFWISALVCHILSITVAAINLKSDNKNKNANILAIVLSIPYLGICLLMMFLSFI